MTLRPYTVYVIADNIMKYDICFHQVLVRMVLPPSPTDYKHEIDPPRLRHAIHWNSS